MTYFQRRQEELERRARELDRREQEIRNAPTNGENILFHTVRNLHFLSTYSTLISRENCQKNLGEKLVKMLWFWTF